MILQTVLAILIILAVLTGWIGVQFLARSFAARHPEFGPAREDGEGCGGLLCLCKNQNTCPKYILKSKIIHSEEHSDDHTMVSEILPPKF
jgi:hypothetical protein